MRGKESVSEIKRRLNPWEEDTGKALDWVRTFEQCPEFDGRQVCPGPRKIGLAAHSVLEHLDLSKPLDSEGLTDQLDGMMDKGILSPEERERIPVDWFAGWFESELGRRMLKNIDTILREVPFTMRRSIEELHPGVVESEDDEFVVVQGIVDVAFLEDDGYVIVDYKTDSIDADEVPRRATEYEVQMKHYARAIQSILEKPVKQAFLYFLRAGIAREVSPL
jgi:ATP-dependent helicase/nuclease subunit A